MSSRKGLKAIRALKLAGTGDISTLSQRERHRARRLAQQRGMLMQAAIESEIPRVAGFGVIRRPEKKGVDTDISLTPIITTTTTNASNFVLNLIVPGTGSWNRIGKRVFLKSLRLKGNTVFSLTPTFATGAGSCTFVRYVVLWDRQPNGAATATFDNIFGITSQAGTESTPDITCPLKYDVMDRYRIIRDWTVRPDPMNVPSFGTGPSLNFYVPMDEYIRLPNLESTYSGQSDPQTIADINTGALYIWMRAYSSSTTAGAAFDGTARLRYVDP